MSETKALRTSNTVDFSPTTCADPTMTATETLSMIMVDLLAVLQTPPKTSPVFNSQRELATAITTLQTLLVPDRTKVNKHPHQSPNQDVCQDPRLS